MSASSLPDPRIQTRPLLLGDRLKARRLSLGLTLEQASQRTGVARSTLSKIEHEQMSPSFQIMKKLATGLDIDIPQLFFPPNVSVSAGRRDITLCNEGRVRATSTYEHELLASTLKNKKMLPFKSTIKAHEITDDPQWIRHDGEEFLLVLSGSICFYSEYYEPIELHVGDSVYYDASMGHILISVTEKDSQVLWVTC